MLYILSKISFGLCLLLVSMVFVNLVYDELFVYKRFNRLFDLVSLIVKMLVALYFLLLLIAYLKFSI